MRPQAIGSAEIVMLTQLMTARISALPRRAIYVSTPSPLTGGDSITPAAGPFSVSTAEPAELHGAGNVDHGAQPHFDMSSGGCQPGVCSFHEDDV